MTKKDTKNNIISLETWTNTEYGNKMLHCELLRYYGLLYMLPDIFQTILDAGCGKGYMSYLLSKAGYQVTALDISETNLQVFRAYCEQFNINQVSADLLSYTTQDKYDGLICQEVLEHVELYQKVISNFHNLFKDNGFALICVPYKENLPAKMIIDPQTNRYKHKNGHLHSFEPTSFSYHIQAAGLRIIKHRLLVNKRLLNWMGKGKTELSRFWLIADNIMNLLFPHRATYMAFLVQKSAHK
ncbi:MAG: class I SAM-dependent methyltransferase [Candidatus Cloacimonetes bacterium]|nr:class I SAM-dependent methyltransferase [Candidatus Cloacimonadota bacterium]